MTTSIQNLRDAVAQNTSYDAFAPGFSLRHWEMLEAYLQVVELSAGQTLINQGAQDYSVFLVESGVLSVHVVGDEGRMQLAILNAGSVVGEGSFFSHLPRSANVSAMGCARLWRLTSPRFSELSLRQPSVALEVSMSLGAVMARRLGDRLKRIAVT